MNADSALLAQVGVGAIDPIGARRAEDIQVESIFQSLRAVRNVRRNDQHFSGADQNFFSFNDEFQYAFQDVRDLLIFMAMHGHNAALPQNQSCEHAFFAGDELPIDQWIQMFHGHVLQSDVLEFGGVFYFGCAHKLVSLPLCGQV